MKLNFIINKNLIYMEFLQSLISWSITSLNKHSVVYYSKKFGNPTNQELATMKKFYNFLKESNNIIYKSEIIETKVLSTYSSKWLWNFSNENYKITNNNEILLYNELLEIFSEKLNKIWLSENKKLKFWKNFLEKYNFNIFDPLINKLNTFFDTKITINNLDIYLILNFNKNFASGYSNQLFQNKIKLGLNNLDKDRYECAIGTIIHEIIHSNFESQSKIFYNQCQNINNLFEKNYKEKVKLKFSNIYFVPHIIEIIFNTISTGCLDVSYIGHEFFENSLYKYNHNIYYNNEKTLVNKIYKSSDELYKYTKKYLDQNKKIDDDYIKKSIEISINNLL